MTDGKLPVVYPMVSELLGQRNARGLTRPPARPTRPDPKKHYVPEILCTGLSIAGAYLLFM